jgi:hypothetical protein
MALTRAMVASSSSSTMHMDVSPMEISSPGFSPNGTDSGFPFTSMDPRPSTGTSLEPRSSVSMRA